MTSPDEKFAQILRDVIPLTCLPDDCDDHQELADRIILASAGALTIADKAEYDSMVCELRVLREEWGGAARRVAALESMINKSL